MRDKDTSATLTERIAQLDCWLEDAAPYSRFDQRHLDRGTPEQAYWHLGYRAALADARALIDHETGGKPGNSSQSPQASPDE